MNMMCNSGVGWGGVEYVVVVGSDVVYEWLIRSVTVIVV